MRLALDAHYSPTIASRLRDRGHDVVAAVERGWQSESDPSLLESCLTEDRVLVTNNVADFMVLARRWQAEGREHAGLVFTSDSTFPRTTGAVARVIRALDALLIAHPSGLCGRVHWLSRTD